MWTMSYLWKCVLLRCTSLLLFLEIATAQLLTCLRSGDCLPGFFCHTGSDLCISCDKCSDARGNLRLCKKECITYIPTSPNPDVYIERAPIGGQEPTIPVIAAIVVAVVVSLVAVIVGVVIFCHRRRSKRRMGTGVLETGYSIEQSELTPTLPPLDCPIIDESVNRSQNCAIPDESVNQRALLLPQSITGS